VGSHTPKRLDAEGRCHLAEALGDTPETVIAVHQLRRGLGRAYVIGEAAHPEAAIVQGNDLPEEPTAFGSDARLIWELLRPIEDWQCVNVSTEVARPFGKLVEEQAGVPVRYYGDVYHVLSRSVAEFPHDAVRQLTLDDLELLKAGPVRHAGGGFGGARRLLAEGIAACAIVNGGIVCFAQTYARSALHADIGVWTHEGWRSRGLATAAAALVVRRVQEAGQTAVWSAGEGNVASLRVAQRLGFVECGRRTYVIRGREG